MAIVCGTDFSLASWAAVEVAACLSARARETLHLVHSLDPSEDERKQPPRPAAVFAEQRLQSHAERLHRLTRDVRLHVNAGAPDDALVRMCERFGARLLVVAAQGEHAAQQAALGSEADRITQRAHVPTLVVRDAAGFKAWQRGDRPLRVVVAVDLSPALESALRWAGELSFDGPCELEAVHLYSPARELDRLGLSEGAHAHEVIRAALEREIRERCAALPGLAELRVRSVPYDGARAESLVAQARELRADVLVIGSKARAKPAPLWSTSTVHQVLHDAACSVVCVPSAALSMGRTIEHARSVLVATDFSPLGNEAVALGRSLLAPGGTLHLLHVLDGGDLAGLSHDILRPVSGALAAQVERARERLAMLRPDAQGPLGVPAELHVVESANIAKAICQVAERLDVEVVCMGSQDKGRLRRMISGSVSEAVLHAAQRPVLFARPAVA